MQSQFDDEKLRDWYKEQKAPVVTIVLIGANIIWFLAMCVTSFDALWSPKTKLLLEWGANLAPLTLTDEPWRILSACFVHIGLTHLILNMAVLWLMGKICERLFGHVRFLVIYLLSGASGFLLSMLINPAVTAAGASGAILGLMGAQLSFVYTHRHEIGEEYFKRTLKGLIVYLIASTIFGLTNNADHAGHFGGVLAGCLFGFLLTPVKQAHRRSTADVLIVLLFTGAMVLLYFGEATGIADWSGKILWMRAEKLEAQGQYKRAIALWETQLGRVGPNASAYLGLARCYLQFNDLKNCLKNLNLAIQHGSNNLPTIQVRAEIYLRFGDYPKAIADETTVLKAKPDLRKARLIRAHCYRTMNDLENAILDYKILLAQKSDVFALHPAACAYFEIGDYDEALRLAELALKQAVVDNNTILLCAGIYSKQGRFDEAWKSIEKAQTLKGIDNIALVTRESEMYLDEGDMKNSTDVILNALAKQPNNLYLLNSLAISYLSQKNDAKAVETVIKAFNSPDNDPLRRSYLAIMYYVAASRVAPGKQNMLFQKCLSDTRISNCFVEHLIRFLQGQTSETELLAKAANKANRTEAHYYIGLRLQQKGKTNEAKEQFRWVLDNGIKSFLEYRLAKAELH